MLAAAYVGVGGVGRRSTGGAARSPYSSRCVVVAVLVRRAVRRFGGVTGDVYGAAIELSLATLLVALA